MAIAVAYLLWRRRTRLALYLVVTSSVGGAVDSTVAAFSIWRTEEGKQPVGVGEGVEPEARAALRGEE
jgi:hypothetical protein